MKYNKNKYAYENIYDEFIPRLEQLEHKIKEFREEIDEIETWIAEHVQEHFK